MRRLLVAGLIIALMLLVRGGAAPVLAIDYPPGWNLVAGPEGSTLGGATGSIFTWQAGDGDYEQFPATSPLHAGWGYWAFFPEGGSLIAMRGTVAATLTVALEPGQYAMVGNPTASAIGVSGADVVYTYTPGGYQNASVIPPGQGAWVAASGPITLGTGAVATQPGQRPPLQLAPAEPAAPAGSNAPAAPAITGTAAQLRASALNAGDLPGYTLLNEGPTQTRAPGYGALWVDLDPASSHFAVLTILEATTSLEQARSELAGLENETRSDPGTTNLQVLGPQAVGDESTAFHYLYRTGGGTLLDDYEVFFLHGTIAVDIDVTDAAGTGSLQRAVALAVIVDGRLAARFPTGTESADVPIAAPVAGGAMLKRAVGGAAAR